MNLYLLLHWIDNFLQIKIFSKTWIPDKNRKAVLIIVHGLAEHIGRYNHLGEFLSSKGYIVEGYDMRGHGRSEGKTAYIKSIYDHVDDLKKFVNIIEKKHREKKIFIIGHSLGGAVTCLYLIDNKPKISGVILSGAVIKISDEISPTLQKLSLLVGIFFPFLKTTKINSNAISRDKNIVILYNNDNLVYKGGTYARTGAEIIRGTKIIKKRMKHIITPILIMHGSSDRLTDPSGSYLLYHGISSKDKTLKIYEEFYHELFNEIGKEKVFKDIDSWLEKRL
tara:strand:+ start:95164 stop:96003 length:840 start_codon:yes stop_codon:yes gene_type:complete